MTSDAVLFLNRKISELIQLGAGPSLAEAVSLMYTVDMVKTYEAQLILSNLDID